MFAAVAVSCLAVLPYARVREACRTDPELRYLTRETDVLATAALVSPRVWEWMLDDRILPILALTLVVDGLVVWRLEWMRRHIGRPYGTARQALDRMVRRRRRAVSRLVRPLRRRRARRPARR